MKPSFVIIVVASLSLSGIAVGVDNFFHRHYLEPTYNYPLNQAYPNGFPVEDFPYYYFPKFIIVSISAIIVLRFGLAVIGARGSIGTAVAIGLVGSSLFSVYYGLFRPFMPLEIAVQIFMIHVFAIAVGSAVVLISAGKKLTHTR